MTFAVSAISLQLVQYGMEYILLSNSIAAGYNIVLTASLPFKESDLVV